MVLARQRPFGHLHPAGADRDAAHGQLRAGLGEGVQERHLHHERSPLRLADPALPRGRLQHDGGGAAHAHALHPDDEELQEPARIELGHRLYPLHPGPGDLAHRVPAPLEPALLLGHHGRHQLRCCHSGGGPLSGGVSQGRQAGRPAHPGALLRHARCGDTGGDSRDHRRPPLPFEAHRDLHPPLRRPGRNRPPLAG